MRLKPIRTQILRNIASQKRIPLQKIDLNVAPKSRGPKKNRQTISKIPFQLGAKQNLKQIFADEETYLKGISNSFKATSTPHTSCLDIAVEVDNRNPKNHESGIFYRVQPYHCDIEVLNDNNILDEGTATLDQVNIKASAKIGNTQKVARSHDQEMREGNKSQLIATNIPYQEKDKNDEGLNLKSELKENNSLIFDDIPLINFELPLVSETYHNHCKDIEKNLLKKNASHINRQSENKKSRGVLSILASKHKMIPENNAQNGRKEKKVEFLTKNRQIEDLNLEKKPNGTLPSNNKISKSSIDPNKEIDLQTSSKKKRGRKKANLMLQKSTQLNFVQDILINEPRRNRRRNMSDYNEIKIREDGNLISRDTLKEILTGTAIRKEIEDFSISKIRKTKESQKGKQIRKNKTRKGMETQKKKTNRGRAKKLSGKQLLKLCSNGKDPIDLLASKSKLILKLYYDNSSINED